MEYKTLKLTLISAQDLQDVRRMIWSTMDPYVVVTISDDPVTQKKTTIHKTERTNPDGPKLWFDITMKPNLAFDH